MSESNNKYKQQIQTTNTNNKYKHKYKYKYKRIKLLNPTSSNLSILCLKSLFSVFNLWKYDQLFIKIWPIVIRSPTIKSALLLLLKLFSIIIISLL